MKHFLISLALLFAVIGACHAEETQKPALFPASTQSVQESLMQELRARGYNQPVALRLNQMHRPLLTADESNIRVTDMQILTQAQRFHAKLSSTDNPNNILTVSGRLSPLVTIPVLALQRNAGEMIEEADLEYIEVEQSSLGSKAITNPEFIVGKKAKQLIASRTILRPTMLAAPVLVRKGSSVMMQYVTGQMTITNQVRALEDGAMGDTIRVLNTQSNRSLDGVVAGPDLVQTGTFPTTKAIALK